MKTKLLSVMVLMGGLPSTVYGVLSITPTSGVLNTTRWQGNTGPGMPEINTSLDLIVANISSNLKYKAEPGGEEGPLASSYTTLFNGDMSGGTITYVGGAFVGPTAYMLVKDGEHNPVWYFFNLTALTWNGTEQLSLSGFWPEGGAISHVSIYGAPGGPPPPPPPPPPPGVPDGGTTILSLGMALLGLGSMRKLLARKD